MQVVDVHAHSVPETLLDALAEADGRLGVSLRRGGGPRNSAENSAESGAEKAAAGGIEVVVGDGPPARVQPGLVDLPTRLAAMDAAGVDVQLLSPWMTLAASTVDASRAADYARLYDDALADLLAQAPGRFLGLANLPLADPDLAAAELRRAVDDLGLVGAEIPTRPAGRELDDPALEVLWETARELDCLLMVHPLHSLQGRGVGRHHLTNLVGNPAETTIAIGHLVLGGVVERHPGVRWLAVHGGGFAPYQVGRWDHAWRRDARGVATQLRKQPSESLRELWFDTVLHSPDALLHLLAVVGEEQVVLGSDHPFEMGDADPVGSVRAVDADLLGVLGHDNVRRLLGRHADRLPASAAGGSRG